MRMEPIIGVVVGCAIAIVGCGQPGEREERAGVRAFRKGHDVRAKDLLDKAVQKRPGRAENAVALNYLGMACWRLGELDRAATAFEHALQLNPDSFQALYNLGLLRYRGGEATRAISLLNEAALTDPSDTQAQALMAAIYLEQNQAPEAVRVLGEALARAPQSPSLLTALALAELQTQGVPAALARLQQALGADAAYAPALFNLCLIHARWRLDLEAARAYAEAFLRLESTGPRAEAVRALAAPAAPPMPPARVETPPVPPPPAAGGEPGRVPPAPTPRVATAEDLLQDARRLGQGGSDREALGLCRLAAEQARRSGDATLLEKALKTGTAVAPNRYESHLAYGEFLLEKKRHAEAFAVLKEALRCRQDQTDVLWALARAAVAQGEFDTAVLCLKKVIEQDPMRAEAQWMQAELLDKELELKPAALAAYRQFARLFPSDPRALRANDRIRALDPPPATPPVAPVAPTPPARAEPAPAPSPRRDAAPLPPGRTLTWKPSEVPNRSAAVQAFNRGSEYQQQGDLARAIHYYTRAIENDPRFEAAFFNLGMIYRERGDMDLAQDAFRHVVDISPDYAAARFNLALVLHNRKAYAAAAEELKQLLRRTPDNAQAHYLLGLAYAEDPASQGLARDHFQRFLTLSPQDPAAAAVRRWLTQHP